MEQNQINQHNMYKHAKNFKFFNPRHRPSSPHPHLQAPPIGRILAKIHKPTPRIVDPKSQGRHAEESISKSNQIIVVNSMKLLQPQAMPPKLCLPSKSPVLNQSINNKTLLKLSSITKHKRMSSQYSPNNSLLQGEQIAQNSNPEEGKRCKEVRFVTDLSPYENRMTKNVASSYRKGLSVRLQENRHLGIKKQLPLLSVASDQLRNVKSQSYLIMQYPSQKIVLSKKSRVKMQIASLTKIMTFYVVLQIIKTHNVDPQQQTVTVGLQSTKICGTSAKLEAGEEYSVQSLLYGMMLPSGNDAASELAVWGGQFLTSNTKRKAKLYAFVQQMNKCSSKLGLSFTNFCNSHGLSHSEALSTTKDVAILCCACLDSQLFKTVVNCKNYTLDVKSGQRKRVVQWKNTNKLLNVDGFLGLKTGTTTTAGPCLASAYQFRNKTFITVVLKAPKSLSRFKQTCQLLVYSLQKLYSDFNPSQKRRLQDLKQASCQLAGQTCSEQNDNEEVKEATYSQVKRVRTEANHDDIFRITH